MTHRNPLNPRLTYPLYVVDLGYLRANPKFRVREVRPRTSLLVSYTQIDHPRKVLTRL